MQESREVKGVAKQKTAVQKFLSKPVSECQISVGFIYNSKFVIAGYWKQRKTKIKKENKKKWKYLKNTK